MSDEVVVPNEDGTLNASSKITPNEDGTKVPKEKKTRNRKWLNSHDRISTSVAKLYGKLGYYPTISQISDDCGMSFRVICQHLKTLSLPELSQAYRTQNAEILSNLANRAKKDDGAAALYFKLTGEDVGQANQNLGTIKIEIVSESDKNSIIKKANDAGIDIESV